MLKLCLAGALLALALPTFAGGPTLPPGFIAEPIGTNWNAPTALAFIDQDELLVGLKGGRVWYVQGDLVKNIVVDLAVEVLNNGDRGILDVAVDPQFALNGYIYVLLVVDPNQDGNDGEQESFSRLVRFTTAYDVTGALVADPLSRLELLGADWPTGIPSCHLSHAAGTMRFLSDGSLVLSHGDGAHFDRTDPGGFDPACFSAGRFPPDQDIGSFRSVYDGSLSGKILRIDPATGLGLPDNPFFDGDPASILSRIWAKGLRNPFRFNLLPGSGPREALFISDVGWNLWEEINLCVGGENFGWPCWEGPNQQPSYQGNDPLGLCPGVNADNVAPWLAWHHANPSPAGFTGSCAAGIAFYSGTSYPPIYRNCLFFLDYSASWLRCARLDSSLGISSLTVFGTTLEAPVDLDVEPGTGNLVYISLGTPDSVYRIRYVGGNAPPVALASANPPYGAAPLGVLLSGSSSSDPEGDPLTYHWDLGDGTTSEDPEVFHVYPDPTVNYLATLTVTDLLGNTGTSEVLITPGNTPPVIDEIKTPLDGELYTVGEKVKLKAKASDLEDDGAGQALAAVWHVDLFHKHHDHPDTFLLTGLNAEFTPDELYDATWYRIRFDVTDSRGLVTSQSLTIYDQATVPLVHLTGAPDLTPRHGLPLEVSGHIEFPGNPTWLGPTTLEFDWGDGTSSAFPGVLHQEDVAATHLYAGPGSYTLTLRATAGAATAETQETVEVLAKRPAVAVFVPLIREKWISWPLQEEIANAVVADAHGTGVEAEIYTYDRQAELAEWMNRFLDDGVKDVLVLLDFVPALVYQGENEGSLAEQWVEHGNGILWSGQGAFSEYIHGNGLTSNAGAGNSGADDVLDASSAGLVLGNGQQILRPPAVMLPSLQPFRSGRALRHDRLGGEWRIGRLYAEDGDKDTDAVVIEHVSGGFYAQFHCFNDDSLPRKEVLVEFLRSYLISPAIARKSPVPR